MGSYKTAGKRGTRRPARHRSRPTLHPTRRSRTARPCHNRTLGKASLSKRKCPLPPRHRDGALLPQAWGERRRVDTPSKMPQRKQDRPVRWTSQGGIRHGPLCWSPGVDPRSSLSGYLSHSRHAVSPFNRKGFPRELRGVAEGVLTCGELPGLSRADACRRSTFANSHSRWPGKRSRTHLLSTHHPCLSLTH